MAEFMIYIAYHPPFLKSAGDIPAFLLKNFPNEDWSEKFSALAIS